MCMCGLSHIQLPHSCAAFQSSVHKIQLCHPQAYKKCDSSKQAERLLENLEVSVFLLALITL